MKIICIGRNYIEHAKELDNPVPAEPVFFLKPDSALLLRNRPFYLPDFSNEIHHEVELVVKINRLGKNIEKKFANRYYNEISLGIDFTARDLQQKCKEQGKPWEIAKGFDNSAPLGEFLRLNQFPSINDLNFHLEINGKTVQNGNTKEMIFSVDDIIAYVSKFMTLKMGDLIFTGTPTGVGPVSIDDHLTAYLEDQKLLDFQVK